MLVRRAYDGQKLPSLAEFLNLTSEESETPKAFDDSTDKIFEAHAQKSLEDRKRAALGK